MNLCMNRVGERANAARHVPWKQDFKKLAVRSQARVELSAS
jgi:hypothetical protein